MSLLRDRIEIGIEEAELETKKTLAEFPKIFRWLLVFLVLGTIPGYFIVKSLSEKIWLNQNPQYELKAKPSFINPLALQISETTVTIFSPGAYAAAVKISNPNLDLSLENVSYEFHFYNAQKQQIQQVSEKLFLTPNQTKYIIVPRVNTSEKIAYAEFKLPQTLPWQKRLSIPTVKLIVALPNSYQQTQPSPAFVVEGEFTNNSPYALRQVRLTFLLFNSLNKIIGISQRDEFTLTPFERRSYKQLWPGEFPQNFSRVEVFADTNTLDPKNVSVSNASDSSGDLGRPESSDR